VESFTDKILSQKMTSKSPKVAHSTNAKTPEMLIQIANNQNVNNVPIGTIITFKSAKWHRWHTWHCAISVPPILARELIHTHGRNRI
jgi:hypothetical protein